MPSLVKQLTEKGLISPPKFLPDNVHYEALTGSVSYGCSSDTSDIDLVGFCIPPREDLFPHLRGEIMGFGTQKERFNQYQQHHIEDKNSGKQYDITIYSIVNFFNLALNANPNITDVLFVPRNCILHSTQISELVRENRKLFLSKKAWHKFKGYAYSQLNKINTKTPEVGSKRYKDVERHGWDLKYGYHLVRLLDEIDQILTTGDLDLQRNRERLKAIRRGEWNKEKIIQFFEDEEKRLEEVYHKSTVVPDIPNEEGVKRLLMQCLEMHYGDLSNCVHKIENDAEKAIQEICGVIKKYNL